MNKPFYFCAEVQKINEAYCVRHGIQVELKFSDTDIALAAASVADTERELYGQRIPSNELGCPLSPVEQALLDERDTHPLIPFRITVSITGRPPEQISFLARTSCDAAMQVIHHLFVHANDRTTAGFKIKVEPIHAQATAGKKAA